MPVISLLAILWMLAEIALFIAVDGLIGLGPTLLAVLLSMVLGGVLVRHQGLRTLRAAEETIRRGDPPLRELVEGLCVLVGGALLILPGFLSDAIGLVLLVPALRERLGRALWRMLERRGMVWEATVRIDNMTRRRWSGRRRGDAARPASGEIIEGDYRAVEEPQDRGEGQRGEGQDLPPLSESRWGGKRRRRE